MQARSRQLIASSIRFVVALTMVVVGIFSTQINQSHVFAQSDNPLIVRAKVDSAIDSVVAGYVERVVNFAESEKADLIVITLDTPGGLLDATRDIVEAIMGSEVPVAVYVGPEGAQAASAGTFIGASADVLAMSPATNIGAASVVDASGGDLPDTLERKANQDAAALIRSIAESRERNISALESTVFSAKSFSAEQAVDDSIADFLAIDFDDVISHLSDAEYAELYDGKVLDFNEPLISEVEFSLLERLLSFVSSPDIAFLLISLGGLGIIVELWNPGTWVPGTLGALFLILGWAGVGQLPFSWAGIALVALAMLLFYLESTAPGVGYFGVAGAIALILGGIFFVGFFGIERIPGDAPTVNRWLISSISAVILVLVLWLGYFIRGPKSIPAYEGYQSASNIVGSIGTVTVALSPAGEVLVHGEHWTGVVEDQSGEINVDDEVEVIAIDGNTLTVRPISDEQGGSSTT